MVGSQRYGLVSFEIRSLIQDWTLVRLASGSLEGCLAQESVFFRSD